MTIDIYQVLIALALAALFVLVLQVVYWALLSLSNSRPANNRPDPTPMMMGGMPTNITATQRPAMPPQGYGYAPQQPYPQQMPAQGYGYAPQQPYPQQMPAQGYGYAPQPYPQQRVPMPQQPAPQAPMQPATRAPMPTAPATPVPVTPVPASPAAPATNQPAAAKQAAKPAPQNTAMKFVVLGGVNSGDIALPSNEFVIGRFYAPESNVFVAFDEKSVSRKHAQFQASPAYSEYFLTDTFSSYGTYIMVDDKFQQLTPNQPERLYNEDIIRFGNHVRVRVLLPTETRASTTRL
jgi:hypothetical protein